MTSRIVVCLDRGCYRSGRCCRGVVRSRAPRDSVRGASLSFCCWPSRTLGCGIEACDIFPNAATTSRLLSTTSGLRLSTRIATTAHQSRIPLDWSWAVRVLRSELGHVESVRGDPKDRKLSRESVYLYEMDKPWADLLYVLLLDCFIHQSYQCERCDDRYKRDSCKYLRV